MSKKGLFGIIKFGLWDKCMYVRLEKYVIFNLRNTIQK